jgi:hypothetical protein
VSCSGSAFMIRRMEKPRLAKAANKTRVGRLFSQFSGSQPCIAGLASEITETYCALIASCDQKGLPRNRGPIFGRSKIFLSPKRYRQILEPTQAPIHYVPAPF